MSDSKEHKYKATTDSKIIDSVVRQCVSCEKSRRIRYRFIFVNFYINHRSIPIDIYTKISHMSVDTTGTFLT